MSYNQIIIRGNVGSEPKMLQYSTAFSVATTEFYKDKNGQEAKNTTWHNVHIKGQNMQYIANNLHKGQNVLIVGKQTNRNVKDTMGNYKSYSSIEAFDVYVPLQAPKDERLMNQAQRDVEAMNGDMPSGNEQKFPWEN